MIAPRLVQRVAWAPFRHLWARPYLRRLHSFPRLSPEERSADLFTALRSQLGYFTQYSFAKDEWKQAARIDDPELFFAYWRELPILSKDDIRSQFNPTALRLEGLTGRVVSSSGSTGKPTSVLHDRGMRRAATAGHIFANSSRGWSPGLPVVAVWGAQVDLWGKRNSIKKAIVKARGSYRISTYELTPDVTDRLIRATSALPRFCLYGYTSMLDFVASDLIRRRDFRFHGRVISAWNGGEPLRQEQARTFQEAFGVPLLNHYGCQEFSTIAFQEPGSSELRVMQPLVLVEIVGDDGKLVNEVGVPGRVVCTSLVCRGTPLIRYDIGDVACMGQAEGAHGAKTISAIQGRTSDEIPMPDGSKLAGMFWAGLFGVYPEVSAYQVRWNEAIIEVQIVAPDLTRARDVELRSRIATALKGGKWRLKVVDGIIPSRQGKRLLVVRDPALQ